MTENPNPSPEHLDDVVRAKMKGLGLDALFHQVDKKRKDDDPFPRRRPDPEDRRLYTRLKHGTGLPGLSASASLKEWLRPRRIPHVIIDAGMTTLTIGITVRERDKTLVTQALRIALPAHVAHVPDKQRRFIVESLRQRLPAELLGTAHVTTLMPRASAILKFISVPTVKDDEIKKMLAFEIEHHLSLAPADAEVDHALLQKETQQTHLVVAAVKKDDIRRHLNLLAEAGIDPDRVELSACALYNAARAQTDKEDLVLQVHIGAAHTDINICRAGVWRVSRGIAWGSAHLTRRLAERLNVSLDDAEKIKRDNGILLVKKQDAATDLLISDEARAWADVLINEMRWTLQNFQLEKGLENVHQVVLSGGGARLLHLNEYLKETLKSRIVFIKPPTGLSWQPGLDVEEEEKASYALCWGADASGPAPRAAGAGDARPAIRLNLLPELQKKESAKKNTARRRARRVLASVLLAGAGIGSLLFLWQLQSLRLRDLKKQLEDTRAAAATVDDLKDRLRATEEYLAGQHTSLDVLREISLLTPADITLDQFFFEKGRSVTLAGRALSHAAAVDFAGALNDSRLFSDAKLRYATQTQRLADGTQEVQFEIVCTLNPSPKPL